MRKLYEALRIALQAIWTNKLRSFLTMLGIIIGVFSVVVLVSVVSGLKNDIVKQVEALGADSLTLTSGNIEEGGLFSSGAGITMNITDEDVAAIEAFDGVRGVSPIAEGFGTFENGDKKVAGSLLGRDPIVFETSLLEIFEGRYYTEEESQDKKKVVILLEEMKTALFGDEAAVGKTVKIDSEDYEVVGVARLQNSSFLSSGGFAKAGVIPSVVVKEHLKQENYGGALIKLRDADTAAALADPIEKKLFELHDNEDVSVLTQEDMIGTIDSIINSIAAALVAVTAISLLVGGIGIMNIMLVSVTERTREIGLRKAVGAKNSDILIQFLIEAVLLSVVGGAIGFLLSLGVGRAITALTDFPTLITWESVALALGVSIGIGVVFGLAPAIRAAVKRPIEALRYE